jgi:hypothetical protein
VPTSQRPTAVTLRSYQVGFGDCFLLTVHYGARARHVLVDFGSTGARPKGPSMEDIANDIAAVTSGRLDVVVATHRHADHISGFAGKSGATIAALAPRAVLQPWTEHPRAARDSTKAPGVRGLHASFAAALDSMHEVSRAVVDEVRRMGLRGAAAEQLRFLGEDNLKNAAAVKTLMAMKGRRYLAYGDDPRLASVLPGVRVHVLGPPTLEQSAAIRTQRSKDAQEYWHTRLQAMERAEFWRLQAAAGKTVATTPRGMFASRFRCPSTPIEARWFRSRLRNSRADEMLQIVRTLDNAMNNTSLILLFEIGRLKMLFPGDAQIENWQYVLHEAKRKPALRKLLAGVTVYKVGHHGSLNATPKSLWNGFANRGPTGKRNRLTSVMSTLPGKHGQVDRKTEVPRKPLVDTLRTHSTLVRTDELPAKASFHELKLLP